MCTQHQAREYIKQTLRDLKGIIDNNTVIVGDFSTPLSTMDRSYRQKTNNETLNLNYTLDKIDLKYIYVLASNSRIHILLKCIQNILKGKSYLRLQTGLKKFKKINIISSIYSNNKGMKLDINNRRKGGKFTNMWKLTHF